MIKGIKQKPLFLLFRCYVLKFLYMIPGFELSFIKSKFKYRVGRSLELQSPVYFNDKLQWLKFNWFDEVAGICADKLLVRKFVEDRVGGKYLNGLIGDFHSLEHLDVASLPNKFVIKMSHGSGMILICPEKDKVCWKSVREK